MIFYYNANGDLISYTPQTVFQGSNLAQTIYFIAPVASRNTVKVCFSLPNGTTTQRSIMTLANSFNGEIVDELSNDFSCYEYKIPFMITKEYGNCSVQFSIYAPNGNEILATESASFIIEQGVYEGSPVIVESSDESIDLNYSNIELITGIKWLNGKVIYKRTINYTLPSVANQIRTFNISNLDEITNLLATEGFCEITYNNRLIKFPINCYFPKMLSDNIEAEVFANFYVSNNYKIEYCVPVNQLNITVTLYYLKN